MRNRLPKVRKRYFVDEPVIVLPIAEYERLIQHLIAMGLLEGLQENSRRGVLKRHALLLSESQEKLKSAKNHYHIPVSE
ncbi:hypothetical protein [Larkinella sp. C7]|jgi:hypothetical protein|uniref:hypothetical protein n=1 Tax=Larkinella sp. C7 TaxID=2576607 RepID=UPI0011112F2C|nr:hypothetical protein [Larkinella sp. C7]